jgi:ketosteroid isomerase-like protein
MSDHRTPEEVFQHHGEVLLAGDIDGIVSDYSDDAIFISPDGLLRGKDGIRQAFIKLVGDVPDAQWELSTVFADDILFLEWSAESAHTKVEDGIDTFVFRDGLIRVQTVRYTLQHKD